MTTKTNQIIRLIMSFNKRDFTTADMPDEPSIQSIIQRNKSPFGKVGAIIFGFCEIFDALVRILSLGNFHTTAPLDYSRHQAFSLFNKTKGENK